MSNKFINDEDRFKDKLENEKDYIFDDTQEYDQEESNDVDSEISIEDENEDINIIIEIDDDDLISNEDKIELILENEDNIILSKHKIEGKHSLKYDSIFKGKKEDPLDEEDMDVHCSDYYKEKIEVDKSSNYYFESVDNEDYVKSKLVKEKVYDVLSKHTKINFLNNRRKPSKSDFNHYFNLLKIHLAEYGFTNVELFTELAVYFSDNLFNMFKLLDNKWRNLIILELQNHIGKNTNSKDITNRNIYEGTEIEFSCIDETGQERLITGVVIETYYKESTFVVDSYEKIYNVKLNQITKILNNTKFKYNLNKLNNIDFL